MVALVPSAKLLFLSENSFKTDESLEVEMKMSHIEQLVHYSIPAPSKGLYKLIINNDKPEAVRQKIVADYSLVIDNENIVFLTTKNPNIGILGANQFKNY